ncbi:alpha/beta-hydrolase [Violaceomyces palustris]|uniref:Alpha/beta-hydrolase n=1 Tax=Violaceomyces palustris TaxID=1673888 RepID=A0ACD0P0W7_9BASI|nr:alpha/beta-hydrolase [Violaceomyces palustris]
MKFSATALATVLVAGLTISTSAAPTKHQALKFKSKAAAAFKVANQLPGFPFEIPDSYAGNLPISTKSSESRQLYFWFFPSEEAVGNDDVVIWLNGGPGCSSLEGLMQENGPFKLPWGTKEIVKNPYSYTKLANVLWVEQPVSVGFTKGTPDITDEEGISKEFVGFLDNFFASFPELKGKKLWLHGESYAGKYIPYIANYIYKRSASVNSAAGLNLQGISINDPSFTGDAFGEELPAVEFATFHQKDLKLSSGTIANLKKKAKSYGIDDFVAKNLHYPPKGHIIAPKLGSFSPWSEVYQAAVKANSLFNVYNIFDDSKYDALGFSAAATEASATNFLNNQTGFKEAIHADPSITWYECTLNSPFAGDGRDHSPAPDLTILPSVIEKSNKSIIAHGLYDFVLIANGSRLGIQNMTWGGAQGFQEAPSKRLIVDGVDKGVFHEERKLTYIEVSDSGHMIPQDDPKTAYKQLQYLLGQVNSL